MTFDEKIELLKNKAVKNDNSIKSSEIESQFDYGSDEYFECVDVLSDANIDIIPDDIEKDAEPDNEDIGQLPFATGDITRIYLNDIGTVKLLTHEEEIALAKEIEEGKYASEVINNLKDINNIDKEKYDELVEQVEKAEIAKNKLVSSNLRLVVHVAKKYAGRGLLFQDLIQSGNMGLMKAADKFDYSLGYQFSTYATWWIKQSIIRAIADQARTIRIPIHVNESLIKYNKAKNELFQKYGRDATTGEIADYMNVREEKVFELEELAKSPDRLDKEVGDDGDSSLSDFIADTNNKDPFEYTFDKKRADEINKALSVLSDREKYIMMKRFGFGGNDPMTLEEIGKELHVSREAIRQMLARAFRKLKTSEYGKNLKELWEASDNEKN